jgi:hypothetical protein
MVETVKRPDRSTKTGGATAIAAVVIVVVAVAALAGVVVLSLQGGTARGDTFDLVGWIAQGVATLAFVLSGALIVSRQPRNVIGWLLVVAGLGPMLSEVIFVWLIGLNPPPTQATPLLWSAVWFTNWSWITLMFPIFLILLTFPTGRLLSRRWRWVVILCGLMITVMLGLTGFSPELQVMTGDEVLVWSIPNPIGFLPEYEEFGLQFEFVWNRLLLLLTIVCVTAVVVRFRRGSSVEREQIKWPLWAMLFFGVVYALGASEGGFNRALDILFGLVLAAIPISVALAVLKYRLFEIDRIISRTVTYLLVVGLLGGLYFASVTTVTRLLQAESALAVAISTLAVAALFNPVRRRIQNIIDRRFNRARYDAQNVMDRFAGTLRDRLDVNELSVGWRDVVTETMEPTAVSVWIREDHT